MATWLSEYKNLKNEMEKQIGAGHASLEQLMLYQELLYRIEVLYASQAFCQTAPVTTDVAVLSGHYQLVDAYIQCLTKERRLGQPADQNLKAKRQTASETLDKVVLDCRKRFSSFTSVWRQHRPESRSACPPHRGGHGPAPVGCGF